MRSLGSLLVLSCLGLSGCILNITDGSTDGSEEETTEATSDTSTGSSDTATGGDGDGDASTSGDGDGDGSSSGDGDGDGSSGDGDATSGDGDGDTTTGDGDGDSTSGDGDSTSGDGDSTTGDGDGDGDAACTTEGTAVVAAINQARSDNGLPAIPLSPSMCHVAHTHSQDLADNFASMSNECNLHSWSDQGSWGACCYTPDHAEAQCMWDKPGELTDYPGNGYEISYATGAMNGGSAQAAVEAWLNSSGHAGVILNQGIWADSDWSAIGGGMVDGYWNVWFGEENDPGWP